MKNDGNVASPNQNIVAIFTAILSALEQQPLGADFEKVLYNNLNELNESNTPAQEGEPIYQLQDSVLGFWDDISFEEMQQYAKEGETTRTLYTRSRSDELKDAAKRFMGAVSLSNMSFSCNEAAKEFYEATQGLKMALKK